MRFSGVKDLGYRFSHILTKFLLQFSECHAQAKCLNIFNFWEFASYRNLGSLPFQHFHSLPPWLLMRIEWLILSKIPCMQWVTLLLLFPRVSLLAFVQLLRCRLFFTRFWKSKHFFKYIKCPFTFSPSGTWIHLMVSHNSFVHFFCVQSSNLLAPLLDLFHFLYTSNPVFLFKLFILKWF